MMNKEKKTTLNLDMFNGVNNFTGIDRSNLIIEGDMDVYVPFVVKQLWFRAVYPKGNVKTQMVGSLEDAIRYKLCVFNAEVYDNDNRMVGSAHGSASTDEDSFIEVAERRAVGKALASAGFTWHNGDFSFDIDVAKTCLNLYNGYINNGTLDIHDAQVAQMYDDALVTVLPEGYGNDTGKPIAAMDQKHLEKIAKNYAMIDSGNALVNAKIKFVYMYQMIQMESEKKPEPEPVTLEEVTDVQEKPKKTRRGRKTKETPAVESEAEVTEQPESEPVAEPENQVDEEPVMAEEQPVTAEMENGEEENISDTESAENEPVTDNDTSEQVAMDEPFGLSEDETEDVAVDGAYDAEELAGVFDFVAKAEDSETEEEFSQEDIDSVIDRGFGTGFHLDESEEEPPIFGSDDEDYVEGAGEFGGFDFGDTTEDPIGDSGDFDIQEDYHKDIHIKEALKKWGYDSAVEVTSDWKAHWDKVFVESRKLDFSNVDAVKAFVDGVPICADFLWKDKLDTNKVVILGDFLNEHKDDVIEFLNKGAKFAAEVANVRTLLDWYVSHVWDEF